jgi:hypothetical protein
MEPGSPNSYYDKTSTNWKDISGNGNIGTLTNGPTYDTGSGGSIVFDGVNDYCTIPDSTSLQVADTLTLSVWVKFTGAVNRAAVFSTRGYNVAGSWQLDLGGGLAGGNTIQFTGPGNWTWNSTYNILSINTWYNICYSKPNNATIGSVYLNNILLTPYSTTAHTMANNSYPKLIGNGTSYASPFPGLISDVMLYNRPLSSTEVTQNFNATRGRFGL